MSVFINNSIRHRFVFALVGIVVFIFSVFSAALIYKNVNSIERQLDQRLMDASNLAVKSLSSALWQYNHDSVGDFIESLFLYEDIVFVKVLSDNGVIKGKIKPGFLEKDFLFFKQSALFSTKETNIDFDGQTIGKIQIAVTREQIKKTIFLNSVVMIAFMILVISAVILTIYFISRRYIFTPLSKLENSAKEIAGGNWNAVIDTSGSDEIGNLSKTFHQMIRTLKATTASRDELEKEIKDRKQAEKEKSKLESQLRHAHKMEAIGSLAGGIAHEFNNILGIIMGNTELAMEDVPEQNPAKEYLKDAQAASLRAKGVVEKIMGFARKSVFNLMPVQLSPIISETLKLVRASISADIEIRQNFSCKSDIVMADHNQISQVLMNLCSNAKNAMPEQGGVLEVTLKNTILDDKSLARYDDLMPGNYVKLTVKDNGYGINPGIIDRIFDPYFTTTSLAEGTGMGLAVVYGIVKHHKGAVRVESYPDKGTIFEVLFPLVETEAEQETEK